MLVTYAIKSTLPLTTTAAASTNQSHGLCFYCTLHPQTTRTWCNVHIPEWNRGAWISFLCLLPKSVSIRLETCTLSVTTLVPPEKQFMSCKFHKRWYIWTRISACEKSGCFPRHRSFSRWPSWSSFEFCGTSGFPSTANILTEVSPMLC